MFSLIMEKWINSFITVSVPDLVFGDQMNSVEIAFPVKELKEEYQNETAWSDPEKTNHHGVLKDHTWHIMGVYDDLYILFDDNGNCAYAPVDWFWEGNG